VLEIFELKLFIYFNVAFTIKFNFTWNLFQTYSKKFLAGLNLVMVFFFLKKKRTRENLVDGFPLKNNNVFDFKFLPLYR